MSGTSIPMQGILPDIGAAMGQGIGNAQQMMQLQQQFQTAKRQNALRGILGQPGAIDQTGQPTADAISKVMGVDTQAGMELQKNALVAQQHKLQMDVIKTKAFAEKFKLTHDVTDAALVGYKQAIQDGLAEPAARARAQKIQTDGFAELDNGGNFSEQEKLSWPKQFDPISAAAHVQSYQQWQTTNEKQKSDARQDKKDEETGWQVVTDPGRPDAQGNPTQFTYNPRTHQSKTLDGQPYQPVSIAKPEATTPAAKAEHDAETIANANIRKKEQERGGPLTDDEKAAERQTARLAPKAGQNSPAALREADARTLALEKFKAAHDGNAPVSDKDKAELAGLMTAERQKATAMAGRNAVMVARGLTSAADAVSDIRNVVELPITIDRGIFGGRRQGPGLMAATKEILANEVTAEDAQAYNTAMAGLERSLGGLATGGLAVSDNVMNQFGKLMIVKGDTNLIKLRKIATMRQNVENGLEGLLTNPQLGGEQSKLISRLQEQVKEAVPWTVHDVNQVEFGKDNKLTVGQFAKAHGVSKPEGAAPAGTQALPTITNDAAGREAFSKLQKQATDENRDIVFMAPDGKHTVHPQAASAASNQPTSLARPAPAVAPAPAAAQGKGSVAAPLSIPDKAKPDDLVDGGFYTLPRGGVWTWDKAKKQFFPAGGQ